MGTGNILPRGNPVMDKYPIQGERSNTPRHASFQGSWNKLRLFGPLARVSLNLFLTIDYNGFNFQ